MPYFTYSLNNKGFTPEIAGAELGLWKKPGENEYIGFIDGEVPAEYTELTLDETRAKVDEYWTGNPPYEENGQLYAWKPAEIVDGRVVKLHNPEPLS